MREKTILIIDDEKSINEMLKLHLEKKGYVVMTACDADKGLQLARKRSPDLIVLDIKMPKKDGWDFYRAICTEHGRTKFPVLIMTGRGELKEVFEKIEVDGFIGKPFEIKDFLREIERILQRETEGPHVFLIDLLSSAHALKIAETLESERYGVTHVPDLKTFEEFVMLRPPSFVVMEYAHSEMPGDELIRALGKILSKSSRNDPGAPRKVPILVYTYSNMDYSQKSLNAGADKYLGEPKRYSDIVTVIRGYELSGGR